MIKYLLMSSFLFAQPFIKDLNQLSKEFEQDYIEQKSAALLKAQNKGWPIMGKRNELFFEIEGLSSTGMPLYNVTENINSAKTISTDDVWPGGDASYFLTGLGMTIGIWDNGKVRDTHQELVGRVQQMDGATTLGNHATHVSGTMIAAGVINNAHGMAHQATLNAYDWNNDESEMADAAANGLGISNHSYGWYLGWVWNYFDDNLWAWFGDLEVDSTEDYKFGFYSNAARDWDVIAYNAPDYLIVLSAGNERSDGVSSGTEHWVFSPTENDWVLSTDTRENDGPWDCIGNTKTGKNVLTVGAVEDIPGGYEFPSQVQLTNFSSVGPLDDGRIKPDIVANGAGLYSCLEQSDTDYGSYWGTSMAAPSVTGSLTLVRQHYETVMDTSIQAATLKGLVIHTADEAGLYTGPDYEYGWGLLNTRKAVEMISSQDDGYEIIEDLLLYGDSLEYTFTSLGADPFKATLSWSDPPGTPVSPSIDPSDIMLVHDLDIRVIDPNGTMYFPYRLNKFDPTQAAFTGDNVVDNVEQVYIELTIPGTYTVRVKHKGILQANQPFGLLITYGTSIPEMVHVSQSGNDETADGSVANPFASIQSALDFAGLGDTILVSSGIYVENIEIENQNRVIASHFIIDGDSSQITNTIIDGGGQGSVISMNFVGSNTKIIGFTIRNGYTTDSGAGLNCVESFPTIENCIFTNNHAGITNTSIYGGGIAAWRSHITLNNVSFVSNYTAGKGGAIFAAQSIVNGSNLFFYDNLANDRGGAISFYKSSGVIDHMTIVEDSAQVEGGAFFMQESELTITSSIIWGNTPQQIAFAETGDPSIINIHYSILDGYVTGVVTHNNGTVNFGLFDVFDLNPLFCNPDSSNYHLAENSPCVGLGENGTNMGVYGIGCEEMVAINDDRLIPGSFKLYTSYPNPFNPITTIRFNLVGTYMQSLRLEIFNITGRLVETLIDDKLKPGIHEIRWNASNYPSGIYFVQLVSDQGIQTQKLILLK